MGSKVSSFGNALYDSKKKQFLGRDGAGWGKLGIFYFFFYLGLAGFFCAMLAVFMALSPRDRPRYYSESSRMQTRSNPISPGLGFRPQPDIDKNLIYVGKGEAINKSNPYINNLDYYLQFYYWQKDDVENAANEYGNQGAYQDTPPKPEKFIIRNQGECISGRKYGFQVGKPCVLVKMNKIVGFLPQPGSKPQEQEEYKKCTHQSNSIAINCYGEYPADVDNIGPINYISESGFDFKCGSLNTKWFPYYGKINRRDVYQAPYIWVQFLNPKPNVLINVICRAYGQNIDFDRKTSRALTRFQIYVEDLLVGASSRSEL
jgi:sodium/potassium-transporting ATPase subunit beta